MPANDENHWVMIIDLLDQIIYWRERFNLSRDLSCLDTIELYEDSIREYLPKSFEDVSLVELCNFYIFVTTYVEILSRGEVHE